MRLTALIANFLQSNPLLSNTTCRYILPQLQTNPIYFKLTNQHNALYSGRNINNKGIN